MKKTIENIEGKSFVKKEDFEKFTKEYFHKLDGKASERIASELLKIVQRE